MLDRKRFDKFSGQMEKMTIRLLEFLYINHPHRVEQVFREAVETLSAGFTITHPPINKLFLNLHRLMDMEVVRIEVMDKCQYLGLVFESAPKDEHTLQLYRKYQQEGKITDEAKAKTLSEGMKINGGIILIPSNWPIQWKENPIWQLGVMIFTAAEAAEMYHKRPIPHTTYMRGEWPFCEAAQAELFTYLLNNGVEFEINDQISPILNNYPQGFASLSDDHKFKLDPVLEGDFDVLDSFTKIQTGEWKEAEFDQFIRSVKQKTVGIDEDTFAILTDPEFQRFLVARLSPPPPPAPEETNAKVTT